MRSSIRIGSFQILIIYLVVVNILGFVSMGRDAKRARKHRWRTPSLVYIIYCLMGGTIGCLIGMTAFYVHRRKKYVRLGIPLILAAQMVLILILVTTSSQIRFL